MTRGRSVRKQNRLHKINESSYNYIPSDTATPQPSTVRQNHCSSIPSVPSTPPCHNVHFACWVPHCNDGNSSSSPDLTHNHFVPPSTSPSDLVHCPATVTSTTTTVCSSLSITVVGKFSIRSRVTRIKIDGNYFAWIVQLYNEIRSRMPK
jgi:hypothetical protein